MKEEKTDFGFKQVNTEEKQKLVKQVFDSVANNYDLMNDFMSFGIHRLWKRHAVAHLQLRANQSVLDLAAGTGDLTQLIVPKIKPLGQVTLCDINHNMLQHARTRLVDNGIVAPIVQGNAENLPFAANTFDRIIIGFGLRNVTHKDSALASIYHVLKPGGRVVILEFSHPTSPSFSKLYDAYSFHVLPFLGKWIANDSESYRYLAESIRMHPDQETLKTQMEKVGFCAEYQNLMQGIVAIHKGIKY